MTNIERLLFIMAALRDPESGCPWDIKQNFNSIVSYTIEEAYEVADAIGREDYQDLKDELGDLLLQVVFHAQMAKEQDLFEFNDVVAAINDKMLRRHPHVFSKEAGVDTHQAETDRVASVKKFWEEQKAKERVDKNNAGVLDGVALALPALKRAQKLQKRAARVGFDWPDISGVLAKIREELDELEEALQNAAQDEIAEELGDFLFACVNMSRHFGIDAEDSLRNANGKFETRFKAIEKILKEQDRQLQDCDVVELNALWNQVKSV